VADARGRGIGDRAVDLGVRMGARRNALFRRHVVLQIPAVLAAARAMTSQLADAEDLVRETLVRAYRGIHRFDGAPRLADDDPAAHPDHRSARAAPGPADRSRPQLRRPDPALSESALSKSAEHMALDREFDAAVEHALRSLTRKQRAMVALRG